MQSSALVSDQLDQRLTRELGDRTRTGGAIYPIVMAIIGSQTQIPATHPVVYWTGLVLLIVGALLRSVTAHTARDFATDHRKVVRDLRVASLFLSGVWGVLASVGLAEYAHSDLSLMVLFGLVGWVSIGAHLFSPDLPLAMAFVHLNMIPALVWAIAVRNRFAWVMLIIFVITWLFVVMLARWSNARLRVMFSTQIQLELQASELRKAMELAEEASRARTQFLANMSHEIRTPLNGVLGVVELLRETPLNVEQKEYVEIMSQSGEHLIALVNDVLDLSKINSGMMSFDMVPIDLRRLLADLCRPLQLSAEAKGLEWTLQIRREVPDTWVGDPVRVRQILSNLISNALKFTIEGGVQVEVGMVDGEHIRFLVKDTGIGIEADKLPGIFEAFEQADLSTTRRFGGTGLGLSISKKLAELMGGRIGVDSAPNQGSVFWLDLGIAPSQNSTQPN